MLYNLIRTLSIVLIGYTGFSQVDFDQYQTLLSHGGIPKDISTSTPEKIKIAIARDRPELEMKYRKPFYTSIYYSIDEILHSEICTYGDEVSKYVSEVAKKILHNDRKTYDELRFYTLKTNETNAFSTDQGIIFVTTGLISQITSEAQLAYVLAHEIAHYKREHVLQRYKQHVNQKFSSIYEMSSYSKDNELEADADGLKMYKNAGYSMDLVTPAFDVLMYAYLPFDEEHIGSEFYNSKGFVVPEYIFPKEKFEITAEENYDDSKSSHPNISKRKGQVNKMMEKDPWTGGSSSLLGEDRFVYIQKIARFEVVRSAILSGDLTNALYSVRLLKKNNPNSLYLNRMEAKIWLTLAQCKNAGVTKPFDSKRHKEGEIAVLHSMLRKFEKVELSTIALRHVFDIRSVNSGDAEINVIYDLMVTTAANTKNFSIERFSKFSFNEGLEHWKTIQDSIKNAPKDSTIVEQNTTNTGSKYDRIKKKRNVDLKVDNSGFDSTLYYLYGMSDIINDSLFLRKFKSSSSKNDPPTQEEKSSLSFFKQFKNTDKKFVLVEPNVATTDASESTQRIGKEIESNFEEVFVENAQKSGITVETDRAPNSLSTEGLNDFSIFKSLMRQNDIYERINFNPVDYSYLQNIKSETGCDVAVIPNILFTDDRKSDPMQIIKPALVFWYLPPVAVTGALARLSISKNTYINFIQIDLDNGKAQQTQVFHVSGKPTKLRLGAVIYQIL